MSGINKVILVGRLGSDPEMKSVGQGSTVTRFSVATSENWIDKNNQKQERTEWHRISMFGKLAEIAGEYLKKGSSVYVEGRLQTRKWQDKEGNERQTTEVVADRMQMLGSKSGSNTYEVMDEDQSYAPSQGASSAPPAKRPAPAASSAKPAASGSGFDDFDDDIPF